MSIQQAQQKWYNTINSIGRVAASSLYPDDIEYYMMAIELVTGDTGETIDYFTFPVMPDQITKTEPQRVNIKKTSGGVTRLSSTSFTPQEISIKGNFGRSFKFYLSPKEPAISGVAFSYSNGAKNSISSKLNIVKDTFAEFYPGVKSGYGAHKILKGIINKATGVDSEGKPFKLYLYNMALGESYLVSPSPSGFTSTQTPEKNMIWDYSVTFDILAPLEYVTDIESKSSLLKAASFNEIQKGINNTAKNVLSAIS